MHRQDCHVERVARAGGHHQLLGILVPALPGISGMFGGHPAQMPRSGCHLNRHGLRGYRKEVLAYIREFDITYLNGPDIGTVISQAFNIQGVPRTYFVAKSGELRGVHIGPMQSPQLDEKIKELLAEPYP